MKEKQINVTAILEDEVESILRKTNYYESFVLGKCLCKYCDQSVSASNLGVIQPLTQENGLLLEFYCDNITCMEAFHNNHE